MKAGINKRELLKEKAGISYLEIIILIISSFAFAYLVASIDEIKPVKASEFSKCCPMDNRDSACNDYPSSECDSQCSSQCQATSCDELPACEKGCCYNPQEGLCVANERKTICTNAGGIWKSSESCNSGEIPECKSGCCVLGSNTQLVTSSRCQKLATEAGMALDFRAGITDEGECWALSITQDKGACLLSSNGCKMLTNQECRALTGKNIIKDKLCTSQILNTTCKPTEDTTCLEGKDEVYFKDSCGNPANIYDAAKIFSRNQSYWENVVKKIDSCQVSPGTGNAKSVSCGNCFYFLGSKCKDYKKAGSIKPSYGENICADMSCKNARDNVGTKDRKNGESWCVYESSIGNGDDVVGSRHYKFSCIDGEVKTEPCADYRNEICVQSNTFDVNGTSVQFSQAVCRVNAWQECLNLNSKDGKGGNGTGLDCFSKYVVVGGSFNFNINLPKYPEGFDLISSDKSSDEVKKKICGMATKTCIIKYKEKFFGGCECVDNCQCDKITFTQQMNDVCRALGDCGLEANVAGKVTSNYAVSKAPPLGADYIARMAGLAKPVKGQYGEVGNITKYLEQAGIINKKSGSSGGGISTTGIGLGFIGAAYAAYIASAYAIGGMQGVAVFLGMGGTTTLMGSASGTVTAGSIGGSMGGTSGFGAQLAGAANAAIAFGIGMFVGSMIAKMIGLSGFGSILMAVGFGFVAISVASIWFNLGPLAPLGPIGWIIGAVLIAISLFFGGKSCKPKIVTFTCSPWQAPLGGADCGKCNNETLPCSKYKCQSLGQACQFINEGSKDEMCISAKDDGIAPRISPWQDALDKNFTYSNISEKGFSIKQADGKCVQSFTPLAFGIMTDKAAQCKFDFTSKTKLDDYPDYFGESNSFLFNHSMVFSMPSVDAILYCLNDNNVTYQQVASKIENTKLYTRCQDMFGRANPTEYVIDICIRPGPDRGEPHIVQTIPANQGGIAYNKTEQNVNIYLNEPSNCKWSKQDKNYSSMENEFSCYNGCDDIGMYGWLCNTTLTELKKGENTFYFRCRDQPWLAGTSNESMRNENPRSYVYKLKSSETPLTIRSIIPNGTFNFGSEPIERVLEVQTAGGADNGKAICSYSLISDSEGWQLFRQTGETSHKMVFNRLTAGEYDVYVKCANDAEEEAQARVKWILNVDSNPPSVVRVYNSAGSLYIFTNKASECAYSNTGCSFIFENGTMMSGGISQEHSAEWQPGNNYYIKCRDSWKNEPPSCSIKVKAYNMQI